MNYSYDSSAFSSWPYWLAKASIMLFGLLHGRKSAAMLNPAASLFAPVAPYRPSEKGPYSRGDAPLVELPISLSPVLRLPLIGTSFALGGGLVGRHLRRAAAGRRFLNLEFHAIDFLDFGEVGKGLLGAAQPDARLPLALKMERINLLFDSLEGREFLTLGGFASFRGGSSGPG
jgi:hypothetical protein